MSTTALIPAAGMGRRMGASINKQYLELAGRPILAHTLALFENSPDIDRIIVISPQGEIPFCREQVVSRYGFRKVHDIVAGGAERQDSVRNGLAALPDQSGDDIVLIHDGVRPFMPAALLPEVIATAQQVGGCVVGVPVKDTVKEVSDHRVIGTPVRERLWLAQTPQAFPFSVIRRAHDRALGENFRGTDDASLVERLGLPVAMVQGSYRNIKITTPEDLTLAYAFLGEQTL
ncbi:MAG: 2-C-methyl-D-erythritol 4-phosphate cytidylyltransferase [Geoalkalibacter sp.]|uniref:2-C-methyl-D-erythritol 4-phosphate cytidylyltransferase n=1 Tax=Geoalkalibacter sp. TaxID=3041440 RepID=UPI003D10D78A